MKTSNAIYISTLISTIGDGMFYIATSWYVYQKMNTSLAVGILLAISLIPMICVFPFSGHVADKYNKKNVAIIMDVFRFVIILISGMGFAFEKNVITVASIYIMTIFLKVGDCFFAPCVTGLIKESFSNNEYARIFSINNTLQQIGTIAGSVVTGMLLSKYDIAYILFADAITFLISGVVLFTIPNTEKNLSTKKQLNVVEDLKDGLQYIFHKNNILLLIVLCGAPNFIVNMINTLLCEHTIETMGLSVSEYSIFDASFGVGCAFMGTVMATLLTKVKQEKVGFVGYILLPVFLFFISISKNFYITLLLLLSLGAIIMILSINSKSLFAQIIDKEYIGRADSYTYTINSIITSFAGILVGYLSSIANTGIAMQVYSLISFTFLFIQYKIIKNRKRENNYE